VCLELGPRHPGRASDGIRAESLWHHDGSCATGWMEPVSRPTEALFSSSQLLFRPPVGMSATWDPSHGDRSMVLRKRVNGVWFGLLEPNKVSLAGEGAGMCDAPVCDRFPAGPEHWSMTPWIALLPASCLF
jgi:hypothetical protein